MKTTKQKHRNVLRQPGVPALAVSHNITRGWPAVRRLALCAALMQCLASAHAADARPGSVPNSQATPAQKPAYVPQGRQMGRYKAFARQAELPSITATNETLLAVGGTLKVDLTQLGQLPRREQTALAAQFAVPTSVITNLVQRVARSSTPDAEQFAQELRTAVIDYRFLQIEWDRYHPPAARQQTKAAGLAALQAGDIGKAWKLYDGLRLPQPPVNVRVVVGP